MNGLYGLMLGFCLFIDVFGIGLFIWLGGVVGKIGLVTCRDLILCWFWSIGVIGADDFVGIKGFSLEHRLKQASSILHFLPNQFY